VERMFVYFHLFFTVLFAILFLSHVPDNVGGRNALISSLATRSLASWDVSPSSWPSIFLSAYLSLLNQLKLPSEL
jgi:hypothetical protein